MTLLNHIESLLELIKAGLCVPGVIVPPREKKSVGCVVTTKQRGGRRTLVSAAAARLSTHAGRAREKSGGSGETLIQWVSY